MERREKMEENRGKREGENIPDYLVSGQRIHTGIDREKGNGVSREKGRKQREKGGRKYSRISVSGQRIHTSIDYES